MPLAGIGSRFIAVLVDTLLWGAGLFVLGLVFWIVVPAVRAFSQLSYQWVAAIVTLTLFLLNWGYFTLFEAFGNGRTPGKRVARIRVIQRSGRPIGLFESMARNLIRFVDQFPGFYAIGVIAVFATRQHQRLGDLAAGTLVVRDREQEPAPWVDAGARSLTAQIFTATEPSARAPHDGLVACDWNRETLICRSRGSRRVLFPPPRHVSRDPTGARDAHCRGDSGQIRP